MRKTILLEDSVPSELKSLLERATEFHGHLGPFLVIGVRMGLIGLKKFGIGSNDHMTIEASLPLHVPFSCIIDGLQVSTNCTVGNQKLSLRSSDSIRAKFKRETDGLEVIVAVKGAKFGEMRSKLLGNKIPEEEVRRLAWIIANVSEGELFEIS